MATPANVDFIRESLITFLSDSLDKIAAFVAFVYFANYFTTESFGAAYTVIGISMVAGSAPKAIGAAISKRVSEDTQTHDEYFIMGLYSISGYVILVGGAVVVLTHLWDSQFEYLALAGLAHLATRPFLYHVERVYDGVGLTGAAATLDFIDGVLTSVLRFVLILGIGLGESGLLYSGAISAVAVGGLAYGYQFGLPTTTPGRAEFHNIKGYAGWSLVSRVSGEAFHNAPTVLAGILISPTLASWVKSAQTLVMPATLSVRSVINSIFVQVSGDVERGGVEVAPIQNGIDIASVLALPILAGALILGDSLMVTVYGDGYSGAGIVLAAVAAAMVFDSQTRIQLSVLNGSDNPDAVAKTNLLHAALAGVALYGAVTLSGMTAFLAAIVIVYASWLAVTYQLVGRHVLDTDRLSWSFVAEQVLAAVVMATVVIGVHAELPVRSWVDIIPPVAVGAAVYGLVLLVISSRCRRMVRTVTRRLRPE